MPLFWLVGPRVPIALLREGGKYVCRETQFPAWPHHTLKTMRRYGPADQLLPANPGLLRPVPRWSCFLQRTRLHVVQFHHSGHMLPQQLETSLGDGFSLIDTGETVDELPDPFHQVRDSPINRPVLRPFRILH